MVVACESALRDRFLKAIIDWWTYSYDVELLTKACQNEPAYAIASSMSLIRALTLQEQALTAARETMLHAPPIEAAHEELRKWIATRPAYNLVEIANLRYP